MFARYINEKWLQQVDHEMRATCLLKCVDKKPSRTTY